MNAVEYAAMMVIGLLMVGVLAFDLLPHLHALTICPGRVMTLAGLCR